jgi:glutaconate CoA-transferase subunit B
VQGETGFPLTRAETVATTPAPTEEQLAIIRRLDPTGIRAGVIKGNPPGVRQAA